MRYAILGGTFDPPHMGHLALAQEAYARLELDRVWFMPAAEPPHKRGASVSPAANRRAMVELAIAGDERFGLETVDLDRPGPSYTVETLERLRARWGAATWIGMIVGWDMLLNLPEWREPARTLGMLDALIAGRRPGYETPDADALAALEQRLPGVRAKVSLVSGPHFDISSTDLRERVRLGLPVKYLTPDPVCAYITSRGLYT